MVENKTFYILNVYEFQPRYQYIGNDKPVVSQPTVQWNWIRRTGKYLMLTGPPQNKPIFDPLFTIGKTFDLMIYIYLFFYFLFFSVKTG